MSGNCDSSRAVPSDGSQDCDKCSRGASAVAFVWKFVHSIGIGTVFDRCGSAYATLDAAPRSKRRHRARSGSISRPRAFSSGFCSCTGLENRCRSACTWWERRMCGAFERECADLFCVHKSLDTVHIGTRASRPPSESFCEPSASWIGWSERCRYHLEEEKKIW